MNIKGAVVTSFPQVSKPSPGIKAAITPLVQPFILIYVCLQEKQTKINLENLKVCTSWTSQGCGTFVTLLSEGKISQSPKRKTVVKTKNTHVSLIESRNIPQNLYTILGFHMLSQMPSTWSTSVVFLPLESDSSTYMYLLRLSICDGLVLFFFFNSHNSLSPIFCFCEHDRAEGNRINKYKPVSRVETTLYVILHATKSSEQVLISAKPKELH